MDPPVHARLRATITRDDLTTQPTTARNLAVRVGVRVCWRAPLPDRWWLESWWTTGSGFLLTGRVLRVQCSNYVRRNKRR